MPTSTKKVVKHRKPGRPKGSKNKPKLGRPLGSKNKTTFRSPISPFGPLFISQDGSGFIDDVGNFFKKNKILGKTRKGLKATGLDKTLKGFKPLGVPIGSAINSGINFGAQRGFGAQTGGSYVKGGKLRALE